jgi:hypothetical protein
LTIPTLQYFILSGNPLPTTIPQKYSGLFFLKKAYLYISKATSPAGT